MRYDWKNTSVKWDREEDEGGVEGLGMGAAGAGRAS